jgi:HSP20 family protein
MPTDDPASEGDRMTLMRSWDLSDDLRGARDDMLLPGKGYTSRDNGQRYDGFIMGSPAWAPAIDISEGDDAYLVFAELPGVRISDVAVTVERGLLTIQGQRHHDVAAAGQKVHRAERRYGPFRRSITLPGHADGGKVEASTEDGLLQVRVPKARDGRAKRAAGGAGAATALLARVLGPGTASDAHSRRGLR